MKQLFITIFCLTRLAFADIDLPPDKKVIYSRGGNSFAVLYSYRNSEFGTVYVKTKGRFQAKWDLPRRFAYAVLSDDGESLIGYPLRTSQLKDPALFVVNRGNVVASVRLEDLKPKLLVETSSNLLWEAEGSKLTPDEENYIVRLRDGRTRTIDLLNGRVK